MVTTMRKLGYSIPEFCDLHSISRAMFYKLAKSGAGPDVIKIGARTIVSAEAAARWRERMEQQSSSTPQPQN